MASGSGRGMSVARGVRAVVEDELESRYESTASSILLYEPLLAPGLLQTEEYARELFRVGRRFPEDKVEAMVRTRMARQNLLRREFPPRCTFFVHEKALRAVVGTARIMHEQSLQLLFASSWPGCMLRVVPSSAGPVGTFDGAFQLMRYPGQPPVVHVQAQTAGLFLDDPGDIATYWKILVRLTDLALDPGQSREWLARLASEYDRAEVVRGKRR
jgi:hypothetical protein